MKFGNKRSYALWRFAIVSAGISILAALIVYNALSTTVIHANDWNHKADSVLSQVFVVQPVRGEIFADDGTVLATNLTQYTIYIDYRTSARRDTAFVAAIDSLADSLAYYYPHRTAAAWKDYLAKPLTVEPKKRKTNHVLLRKASYLDYERIRHFPFFKRYRSKYTHGLHYDAKEARVMPYGNMAQRSIGRCNYRLVPNKVNFNPEDTLHDFSELLHGYSGLECALDSTLAGRPGTARYALTTQKVTSWVDEPAVNGSSVRTTINIDIQDIVETELQAMLQQTEADWGTAIVMEVGTGAIKAISNLDRDKNGRYIEAMNYALQAYEPGSVMKPISMIVALEDGFAFPLERTMAIGHSYAYAGGSPIHDTHSPAALPVSRFIEYSSNIGMTKLIAPRYENNLNGFRERLRQLGFFDQFNTGMVGERRPYFPTLDPKAGGRVSLSRMAYGYSTMIPPLYTCAVYNAIASNGKFVRPRMVDEIIAPDGTVTKNEVSYVRDSICSRKNAKILQEMLLSVVYGEGGTAKSLKSDIVKIAGKTGTCRIANETKIDTTGNKRTLIPPTKGYKEGQYRLAFCGFFPYEKPRYTCMVLISKPAPQFRGAATTSGMVVKNIALKMHSRGLLDERSDFRAQGKTGSTPVIYAGEQANIEQVRSIMGDNARHFRVPATAESGHIPDVKGLGVRDAIARIEDAGYRISVSGQGYAVNQNPPANQLYASGKTVHVTFSSK